MTFPPALCLQAASILAQNAPASYEPDQMFLCSHCLEAEAADGSPMDTPHVGLPFYNEGEKLIQSICGKSGQDVYALQDCTFSLIECFAVILRERSLANPAQQLPPAQRKVLSYFENCGHWHPDDGTLVSQFYYKDIPEKILTKAKPH